MMSPEERARQDDLVLRTIYMIAHETDKDDPAMVNISPEEAAERAKLTPEEAWESYQRLERADDISYDSSREALLTPVGLERAMDLAYRASLSRWKRARRWLAEHKPIRTALWAIGAALVGFLSWLLTATELPFWVEPVKRLLGLDR